MEKILFLAHTQADGSLPAVAREALNAAVDLAHKLSGASLTVGLIGREITTAADSVAACGAAEFLAVTGDGFADSRYASDVAAVEALVRRADPTLVIAPTTSRFSRALPGAVERLKGRIETHISGIEVADGTLRVQRWYYRQRMVATLTRAQRPWFLVIDGGVFPAWQGASGSAAVESIPVSLGA